MARVNSKLNLKFSFLLYDVDGEPSSSNTLELDLASLTHGLDFVSSIGIGSRLSVDLVISISLIFGHLYRQTSTDFFFW